MSIESGSAGLIVRYERLVDQLMTHLQHALDERDEMARMLAGRPAQPRPDLEQLITEALEQPPPHPEERTP